MPEFNSGELKTAIAPITVSPSGLSCETELFLGPDELTRVATSGRRPFSSTGASQSVRLPITMPSAEGTYHAYIDVYAGGLLIAAYQAIEDVVIAPPFDPWVYDVNGDGYIDESERQQASDDWTAGVITTQQMLQVFNLPAPPPPPKRIASCVYCGAPFTTESDLVAHMNANHPGKPYIVWAYLPEGDVVLTRGSSYAIKAKVYAPPTSEDEYYRYAFWSYRWNCIAALIYAGGGVPAGFYVGEASSYHCHHRLGYWYCPPLGESIVRSDCYFTYPGMPGRWYDNPVWKSVDIGLRVNFVA